MLRLQLLLLKAGKGYILCIS